MPYSPRHLGNFIYEVQYTARRGKSIFPSERVSSAPQDTLGHEPPNHDAIDGCVKSADELRSPDELPLGTPVHTQPEPTTRALLAIMGLAIVIVQIEDALFHIVMAHPKIDVHRNTARAARAASAR